MVSINSMVFTVEKTYSQSYYSGTWFYNKTLSADIWGESVEAYDETQDLKRIDYPRTKSNWKNGTQTKVVDLNRINSAITITGFLSNPTDMHTWDTTTLNGGITDTDGTITLTNASAFPTQGMIIIEDEFIYYTGKSSNDLTGCQRGFFDTVAAAHLTATTVGNRTDGASCKLAILSFIKKHGGTMNIYWRNRKIEVFQPKYQITDTKRDNDGLSQEPTNYPITANFFEGTLQ